MGKLEGEGEEWCEKGRERERNESEERINLKQKMRNCHQSPKQKQSGQDWRNTKNKTNK